MSGTNFFSEFYVSYPVSWNFEVFGLKGGGKCQMHRERGRNFSDMSSGGTILDLVLNIHKKY